MATAFGAEGCVLLHMLAEIEPRVRVFNLDTGYQFPETLELRDRIAERYGIEVEMIRPETTVAEYEAQHGGPLYVANPDQCCYDRKIVPLRRALVGYDAWITAIRADQSAHRAAARGRGAGPEVRPGEDQPALELDAARRLGVHRDAQGAVQPAARPGICLDRLLAVHAGRRPRRGRAGGPMGGPGQDRMRPALAGQQPALSRETDGSVARSCADSMKISAKAEYACLAVLALARHGPEAPPMRIREISRGRTGSPSDTWCRSCCSSRGPGW